MARRSPDLALRGLGTGSCQCLRDREGGAELESFSPDRRECERGYDQRGLPLRPDLNGGKSLAELSPTTKQNLSKICVDFRQTFGWKPSAHQIAKR
jgi:hypothetical protein